MLNIRILQQCRIWIQLILKLTPVQFTLKLRMRNLFLGLLENHL